ncbi:gluconate:H+ symporter (GntP) family transporter [Segniliparus rugosus ATCC BAA-974]|uniref:Gluconate:H+ symporter (GntP) family transporter n=2 Tax=Segniliparus rugosus TaxID=286804 RepID=E5XTL1_SEGRC|nr:gluconate:H+ symporter (GntP) family transporter [Segniliparus rugosus ATCC BAA-974]
MAMVVVLISRLKLHPFLALTAGALAAGFGAGLGGTTTVESFVKGFGTTMADVGILIGLGAMFGKLLADSGGADTVVDALLARSSPRMLPWTMLAVGLLVGLPLFFEVGAVLLMPVIFLAARRSGLPVMRIAIPALAALSTLHCLVPPHPGALAAVAAVHANLGITLLLGLACAIPVAIISGPVFGSVAARWVPVSAPALFAPDEAEDERVRLPVGRTITVILVPIALMVCRSASEIAMEPSHPLRGVFDLLGTPLVALGLGVLAAAALLGMPRASVAESLNGALAPMAGLTMMIGSGGGYKQVLVDAGVSGFIARAASDSHLPLLLLAWLVSALIRVATGSATVASVTASGILAPLTAGLSPAHVSLLVLAIGSGSVFFSYVNDAGFWLVKGYFDLDIAQTVKTWTALQTLISLVGLSCVLVLAALVP